MKTKLLLYFMALGFIGASAQPHIVGNSCFQMPISQNNIINILNANSSNRNGIITTTKRTTQANAEMVWHNVNFILDFEPSIQKAKIYFFNDVYAFDSEGLGYDELVNGSNNISVPGGTYDIIVTFDVKNNYGRTSYSLFVFRELLSIDDDLTLSISASEAKNHIHFQTLNIDGSPATTNKYYVDDNWNVTLIEQGSVDDVISERRLFCKDNGYGVLFSTLSTFGPSYEGAYNSDANILNSDFFVNDVSERYAFYCYRVAIKETGHEIYTSAYETLGATDDITITNDPAKFALFEAPFRVPTQNEDLYFSFNMLPYNESDFFSSIVNYTFTTMPVTEEETCKFYLGGSPEDSQSGFVPFIQPNVSIKTIEHMDWGDSESYNIIMMGSPMTMTNNKAQLSNNGAGSYIDIFNKGFFSDEPCDLSGGNGHDFTTYPKWPTHPIFSYSTEKILGNLCNNSPLLISNPYQYESTNMWTEETERKFIFNFDYIGRYGEKKIENNQDASVEVTLNGEEYHSGKGQFTTELSELLNGLVEATIINENVNVDDMAGSNITRLHFIAGTEDQTPPTATMLHFKDSNGNVTDRFATSNDGTLEFSAGDFNFILTPNQNLAYNRYAPESVEVSYSPYGEDNWNELAVEEVPENYWPMMGWFYTGSLASVTGVGMNGWFDLKIRLTDAVGNWQEQVISPAFRIEDQSISSFNTVHDTNAHEVARYNTAGQRVDANIKGIIIVKMSDGSARKIFIP